jgi:hypothetical protein
MVIGVVQINFQVGGSFYGTYSYSLSANGQSEDAYFNIYVTP